MSDDRRRGGNIIIFLAQLPLFLMYETHLYIFLFSTRFFEELPSPFMSCFELEDVMDGECGEYDEYVH